MKYILILIFFLFNFQFIFAEEGVCFQLQKKALAERDSTFILFSKAADCFYQQKNKVEWGFCRRRLAYAATSTVEAIQIAKESLQIAWWAEDEETGKLYMQLGYFYDKKGNFLAAKTAYEKAKHIQEKTNNVVGDYPRYIFRPLANIYTRIGDTEKAIALLEQIVNLYKTDYDDLVINARKNRGEKRQAVLQKLAGHVRQLAYVYSDLGVALQDKGEYNKAIDIFNQGLSILKDVQQEFAIHLPDSEALLIQNEATALAQIEQYQTAHQLIDPAFSLSVDTFFLIGLYHIKGSILAMEKNYKEANDYLQIALTLSEKYYTGYYSDRREVAKIELALGHLEQDFENYGKALAYYQKALQRVMPNFKPKQLCELPNTLELYAENVILEALTSKGEVFWKQYQKEQNGDFLDCAANSFELAIASEEVLRKSFSYTSSQLQLLEENRQRYEYTIAVLKEQFRLNQNPEWLHKIWTYAEKSSDVVYRQQLAHGQAIQAASEEVPTPILEAELNLQLEINETTAQLMDMLADSTVEAKNITEVRTDLLDLKEKHAEVLAQIKALSQKYYQLSHDTTLAGITEVQQNLLKNDELLVKYFYGLDSIYIIGLPKKGQPLIYSIARTTDLEDRLEKLISQLSDRQVAFNKTRDPEFFNYFAAETSFFYEQLLAPLEKQLGGFSRLMIIPDGQLHHLPFDLLLVEKQQASISVNDLPQAYTQLPYLFQKAYLRYGHSATVMCRYQAEEKSDLKPYLGVAPDYADCENLDDVKEGQSSVETISNWFEQVALLGKNAVKEQFLQLAPEYEIVHFHGHAEINPNNPLLSRLAFSCSENVAREAVTATKVGLPSSENISSPHLSAAEIFAQRLEARLFVMGGCKSGLGQFSAGEGLQNLERALRYAGVRNIMMSLWDLDDKATADLQSYFFKNIHKGMTYDEAFRQARVTYMNENNAFPYYWGGFVIVGESLEGESWRWGWYLLGTLFILAGFVFYYKN